MPWHIVEIGPVSDHMLADLILCLFSLVLHHCSHLQWCLSAGATSMFNVEEELFVIVRCSRLVQMGSVDPWTGWNIPDKGSTLV